MHIRIKTYHHIIRAFLPNKNKGPSSDSTLTFLSSYNKRQISFFLRDCFNLKPQQINVSSLKYKNLGYKKVTVRAEVDSLKKFYETLRASVHNS